MAFLTPDATYKAGKITVKRKFLPEKQRPNRHLNTKDFNPEYITIHNTDDINEAAGTNDAEQYARATFNGNMGDVTVHFYIDETDCWQIVPMNEVAYHAADGVNGTGNSKSVAIEIIMDGSGKDYDTKAEDRGAQLAAWLLVKYNLGIDKLKTHRDWYPAKYCPQYILPHWAKFKSSVEKYMKELTAPKTETKPVAETVPTLDKGKYFRVFCGGFATKDLAETYVTKLKSAGFDAEIATVVLGDVDGDGAVTAADAREILRTSVGLN